MFNEVDYQLVFSSARDRYCRNVRSPYVVDEKMVNSVNWHIMIIGLLDSLAKVNEISEVLNY